MRFLKLIIHVFLILFLTTISQIGGISYFLAILLGRSNRRKSLVIFMTSYAAFWIMASFIAPLFGRVPLSCGFGKNDNLKMQSPLYCVLNRHYVTPDLKEVAFNLADHVEAYFPGTKTLALDGNFPFITGFSLLPHLSHDDGRKLDLAFYYSENGKTKSPIGYWAFEAPSSKDYQPCKKTSAPSVRWNMSWFRVTHNDLSLDPRRTKAALKWLESEGEKQGVSKVFVEPHLKYRFGLTGDIIRFQGCRAARHDDHIHLQIR